MTDRTGQNIDPFPTWFLVITYGHVTLRVFEMQIIFYCRHMLVGIFLISYEIYHKLKKFPAGLLIPTGELTKPSRIMRI
jgi:hypothetical protein